MINLEAYQYDAIEFTLNKKNSSDNITLALSDGNDYNFEINLKELFTSEEAGIYINENTYIISLQKNFPNVSNVKYIYFWAYPPKTSGSIEYEVSGLKFIKP